MCNYGIVNIRMTIQCEPTKVLGESVYYIVLSLYITILLFTTHNFFDDIPFFYLSPNWCKAGKKEYLRMEFSAIVNIRMLIYSVSTNIRATILYLSLSMIFIFSYIISN